MNRYIHCIMGLLMILLAPWSTANELTNIGDNSREFGPYTVHFSTFNSNFLQPDIANLYNLVRAKDQTLLNIAVKETATDQAVSAVVTGTAKNLMQQSKTIDFKTIREQDAVYYIGAIRHDDEELFHIDISVTPDGQEQSYQFRITRKLYRD